MLNFKNEHGLTFEETAEHFGISIRSLMRWNKKPKPDSRRPKRPSKIAPEKLREDIEKFPDDYQYERAERFGTTQSAICKALKRLGVTRKKNIRAQKS